MILLALEIVAAGTTFTCTPTRVWDGDGPIWCAEGPRIRLAGIASREMDGSCRPNHPCPAAPPIEARDYLAGLLQWPTDRQRRIAPSGHVLVRGPALRCVSYGSGGGSRTAARCTSPIVGDLSCEMISAGMALRWERYWGRYEC